MKQKLVNILNFIKKSLNKVCAFLPTAVPRGMSEFDTWSSSIITTYDFPNNDSVRFALATMIMHSGPYEAYKPKRAFALAVKASMAKQIAGAQFQEIKLRQQAAIAASQQAEATAPKVAPDVQSVQN